MDAHPPEGLDPELTVLWKEAIALLKKCRTWTPEKEVAAEAALESAEDADK